jgi:rare lipoprotein A
MAAVAMVVASSASAYPTMMSQIQLAAPPAGEVIVGIASFYDTPGELTSSGEYYDPNAFTAAAQLDIRNKFGGIRYGKNYRPSFAVAEYGGKRAILKFNDVGPLRPGRKFDLSRAAMAHFGGIDLGLLPDFKIVLLPGDHYTPGPLVDAQLASMGAGDAQGNVPAAPFIELASLGPVGETPIGVEEAVMARSAPSQTEPIGSAVIEVAAHADADVEIVGSIDTHTGPQTVAGGAIEDDFWNYCEH